MAQRNDLDADTAAMLADEVRRHLDDANGSETPGERARRLHAEGKLDEETVANAVEKGDRDFVTSALALLGEIPTAGLGKMIEIGNANAVTAAVWKAGLSMRLAVKVQSRIARIPPAKMLNARNGTDYPLSQQDMMTQVEMMS